MRSAPAPFKKRMVRLSDKPVAVLCIDHRREHRRHGLLIPPRDHDSVRLADGKGSPPADHTPPRLQDLPLRRGEEVHFQFDSK